MKKLLTITLLVFGFSTAFAQDDETSATESGYNAAQPDVISPVRLGFLARPALTWLTAENPELNSKGARMGFAFGLTIDMMIAQNPNYAFNTGILMNLADGGRLRYADAESRSMNDQLEPVQTDVNLNFQWLEIPATLKLKTNQIGYMTYFGQLGLQGGVKLGAKQNGDYEFVNDERTVLIEDENANSGTRLFNAGLLVGAGAEYNISGKTYIVFGITYYRGFTNVLKGNVLNTDDKGEVLIDHNNMPVPGAKRRAMLSNISLNLGVIF